MMSSIFLKPCCDKDIYVLGQSLTMHSKSSKWQVEPISAMRGAIGGSSISGIWRRRGYDIASLQAFIRCATSQQLSISVSIRCRLLTSIASFTTTLRRLSLSSNITTTTPNSEEAARPHPSGSRPHGTPMGATIGIQPYVTRTAVML